MALLDRSEIVFSNSPGNEEYILRALQKFAIKKIWQLSKVIGKLIYVIIDDTMCKKTKCAMSRSFGIIL
ncbi:hypothetical protein LL127_17415 [Clostridium estertheticum]|uniref:hypothetical protein n=1 Tax=Clostridium estertheticum TaxID=238834 RepID=UPI001CF12C67|nr:hypothetical protein [Clostridium estertheticum]MCB2309238.1 hypothetical protein [Clostridium estertheticum]MCB2347631.1 hypothetical protein [Clostridium estertheticum]WAG45289.1 hypothetical protein LL127_17415 [Clostridium estertheticum]